MKQPAITHQHVWYDYGVDAKAGKRILKCSGCMEWKYAEPYAS